MEHLCITTALPSPVWAARTESSSTLALLSSPAPLSKEPTLTYWRTFLAFRFDWLCYQWHGNVSGVQVLDNVGGLLLSDQSRASFYWLEFQSLPVEPYREDAVSTQPLGHKSQQEETKKTPPKPENANLPKSYFKLFRTWQVYVFFKVTGGSNTSRITAKRYMV